jgi:hypothetical protein
MELYICMVEPYAKRGSSKLSTAFLLSFFFDPEGGNGMLAAPKQRLTSHGVTSRKI